MKSSVTIGLCIFGLSLIGTNAVAGRYYEYKDEITDRVSYNGIFNESGTISPMVRCNGGKPQIHLFSKFFLGRTYSTWRDVSIRFDENQALTFKAQYADEGLMISLDRYPKEGAQILRGMSNSKHVIIRLLTYNDDIVQDSFDLNNEATIIDQVLNHCLPEA